MNAEVLSKELNENSLNILDQPKSNSNEPPPGAGADPNIQNQAGKTLVHYVAERNDTGGIEFFLKAGADPNTKGQDGKTLSYYLDEKLLNILNQLASNSNLLDNSNNTQYIRFLLGTGANPNVQNQDGKTLLHYVAERNDIKGIRHFVEVIKANPNMQD